MAEDLFAANSPTSSHAGNHSRLRQRFLATLGGGMLDYEFLKLLQKLAFYAGT